MTRHTAATVHEAVPCRGACARTHQHRCAALTLLEMMLALVIVTLVGVAIASMLTAVTYGTRSSKDMRGLVVTSKTLGTRFAAHVREADMVLAADDDFLVLWVRDADGNGTPSVQELQRIEHDPASRTMISYAAAPGAADVAFALDADFDAVTQALIAGGAMTGELWSMQVSDGAVALDAADPRQATLVSYRWTLASGDMSETAIGAAALRN